jgi:hypothetical protein
MKRLNHPLSPNTEADLQKLVEPLASYIAAVARPRIVLTVSLILLFENLQLINKAANQHLASSSENRIA